jgi:hypothetical protein
MHSNRWTGSGREEGHLVCSHGIPLVASARSRSLLIETASVLPVNLRAQQLIAYCMVRCQQRRRHCSVHHKPPVEPPHAQLVPRAEQPHTHHELPTRIAHPVASLQSVCAGRGKTLVRLSHPPEARSESTSTGTRSRRPVPRAGKVPCPPGSPACLGMSATECAQAGTARALAPPSHGTRAGRRAHDHRGLSGRCRSWSPMSSLPPCERSPAATYPLFHLRRCIGEDPHTHSSNPRAPRWSSASTTCSSLPLHSPSCSLGRLAHR